MSILLVGAGGHARVVVELMALAGVQPSAYADPKKADWLDIPQEEDALEWLAVNPGSELIMGIGGVTTDQLSKRLEMYKSLVTKGFATKTVIHPQACVSPDATIGEGVTVMANAVIQPGADVCSGSIINTGAIIEHDSVVGNGTHVAPGAIVLGQCTIGEACMIGAGSVILPGNVVENRTLVRAQTRFPR